jgi:hypothetical protein
MRGKPRPEGRGGIARLLHLTPMTLRDLTGLVTAMQLLLYVYAHRSNLLVGDLPAAVFDDSGDEIFEKGIETICLYILCSIDIHLTNGEVP